MYERKRLRVRDTGRVGKEGFARRPVAGRLDDTEPFQGSEYNRSEREKTRKVEQRACPWHAFLFVVGEGCPKCKSEADEAQARPVITVREHKP